MRGIADEDGNGRGFFPAKQANRKCSLPPRWGKGWGWGWVQDAEVNGARGGVASRALCGQVGASTPIPSLPH